ncbi:hypothetical protein RRG08_016791 [Elysia crispata]|uniref:Uncharacterized protein n=1 Tax=Elysia crispata TaxID=231223 RepID=A0AAE0ZZW0_9GAST|nr:hypothetical protein RRG08_016791 [Elysia crispata]
MTSARYTTKLTSSVDKLLGRLEFHRGVPTEIFACVTLELPVSPVPAAPGTTPGNRRAWDIVWRDNSGSAYVPWTPHVIHNTVRALAALMAAKRSTELRDE